MQKIFEMKKDISSRKDIILLVNTFYEKVKANPEIGPFFTDLMKVNWDKHLQVMYDFWDNAIFYSGKYSGNPLKKHQHLHSLSALTPGKFTAWLQLFTNTVDELFEGEKATLAKQRANNIATVMQIKIIEQGKAK
jgi:hemoglobin